MALDFSFERQLIKDGNKLIIGVDEVGVGPLAGVVTATAVTTPAKFSIFKLQLSNLRDSKQLTPAKREEFYRFFLEDLKIDYATCSVSEKVIDKINIFEARKLAAKRAIIKLEKNIRSKTDLIILDGKTFINIKRNQKAIVKGDEKVTLCAIASIIAKVTRDRMMVRLHKKYPEYRFDLHKGYGTKLHFEMLAKFGPSPIHRKSFNLGRLGRYG